MDVYCIKCGEPWDIDEFHEVATTEGITFRQVQSEFANYGCTALNANCSTTPDRELAKLMAAAFEISGDDIDGAAADIADWLYLTRG